VSSLLIGSSGYVGSHISQIIDFDLALHRPNIDLAKNTNHDLLVCAGLPAAKWQANNQADEDWANTENLISVLSTVNARKAVLVSTIDVYQPPVNVDEEVFPSLDGTQGYGRNRARFENFFINHFPGSKVIRLPGLFSNSLRKNLVYDLLNNRAEFIQKYSPESEFQFMNLQNIGNIFHALLASDVSILNVSSEPLKAADIAAVFGYTLKGEDVPIKYDVKTRHADYFDSTGQYLFKRESILSDLTFLMNSYGKS
jgi:nucleoside-diphosphate-sugar epimerase